MDNKTQKTAFLFPGQGSQFAGMGRDLAEAFDVAKQAFAEADDILDMQFSRLMWDIEGNAINDTVNTQPALFVHSLAAFRILQELHPGIIPAYVAGHSLGEISALAAVGAFNFADGLRLVRRRGQLMQLAGEKNPGGMAAILGLDIPSLEEICLQANAPDEVVLVANDNCPGQVVLSGHKSALERAMTLCKQRGARRALPLAVSIAAHSPLMDAIQGEWNEEIERIACSDSEISVISNVFAEPISTAEEIKVDISRQMQARVRWVESLEYMREQNVSRFIELGAGSVLAGLVKRTLPEAQVYSLGSPKDFETFSA